MSQDTDINYRSYADEKELYLSGEVISPASEGKNASDYDDILKLSHVHNALIMNCKVQGRSKEDGVDLNRYCHNVMVSKCEVEAGAKYAFTIKGGCSLVILANVVITKPGKWVDIDLGNHSDEAYTKTREVYLHNVTRADGKPVRVRVGHSEYPHIIGGNVKILHAQSLALKAYVHAKHHFKFIQ